MFAFKIVLKEYLHAWTWQGQFDTEEIKSMSN